MTSGVFLLLVIAVLLFGIVSPIHLRQRVYHSFCLNPDVDWTQPKIQSVWNSYGTLVGRFLSVEVPYTLDELVVLCKAYATQHGSPDNQPVAFYKVDYDLQILFEVGIVLVSEWQPFPTSPLSYQPLPLRVVGTKKPVTDELSEDAQQHESASA
jgi:hypothetical protein